MNLSFLPSKLCEQLMPFQKEGIEFIISKSGRCLVADEMGLGKTLQALSAAYYYKDEWPLLIVVPSSLRYPWIEEIERWLPHIHPHDINLIQACTDVNDISTAKITIVTYGLLRFPAIKILKEALANQKFKVAIVDESHYMKNWKSATSKYLVPLLQGIERKILLSGTPALARPEELYPQLSAIQPKMFPNFTHFAKKYCDARMIFYGKRRHWDTSGASNLEELQTLMTDKIMIRRLKKDVLTQLPPKQRQRIPFEIKDSALKKEMDSRWDLLNSALGRSSTNVNQVLEQKELSSNFFEIRKNIMGLYQDTCKVKLGPVREYVKMLCENAGLKFLLFAHHHVMMDSVSEQLHEDKVKFIRIDGNTVQQDRPRLVHQFQVDADTRVAVLSIQAAGVGLTLTAAQLVVFAELDWTPGKMEQAEDRAHRIGQQSTVQVHYLVAKGTLDEWFWNALAKKTVVISTTLNGRTNTLKMDTGQASLTSCLTNADVFIPKSLEDEEEVDVGGFFASQRARNQKSVLDYFTPRGASKARRKITENKGFVSPIVVNDSGGEQNTSLGEFQNRKSKRKRKKRRISEFSPLADGADTINDSYSASDLSEPEPEQESQDNETSKDTNVSFDDGLSEMAAIEKDLDSRWSCNACTFFNHSELRNCEMCSTPKARRRSKRKLDHSPAAVSFGYDDSVKKRRTSATLSSVSMISPSCGDKDQEEEPNDNKRLVPNSPLGEAGTSKDNPREKYGYVISDSETETDKDNEVISQASEAAQCIASPHNVSRVHRSLHDMSNSEDSDTCDKKAANIAENNNKYRSEQVSKFFALDSETDGDKPNNVSYSDAETISDYEDKDKLKHSENEIVISDSDTEQSENIESEMKRPKLPSSQKTNSQNTPKNFRFRKTESLKGTPENNRLQPSPSASISSRVTISSKDILTSINSLKTPSLVVSENKNNEGDTHRQTPKSEISVHPASMSSTCEEDIIQKEMAAANDIFASPSKAVRQGADDDMRLPWRCAECDLMNDRENDDCDGCLQARPDEQLANEAQDSKPETLNRSVNLDDVTVYTLFKYCCSKNTNRIYPYDERGDPLHVNFTVLDVEMENYAALPDVLLHPHNLKHIRRFLREWKSLGPTKRRVVTKSGMIFTSPLLVYDEIKNHTTSKQRYLTKEDVCERANAKAQEVGGTVRLLTKFADESENKTKASKKKGRGSSKSSINKDGETSETAVKDSRDQSPSKIMKQLRAIPQVLDAEGRPLCLQCHEPYTSDLLSEEMIQQHSWQTRFCSRPCMHQYWMQRHQRYGADQVYEEEHGVCQLCHFDVNAFFMQIKVTSDLIKRAKLIKESKFNVLKSDIKEKMVKRPHKGLFWQIDHITPVYAGGGMCDIDNLRTLCTLCHRDVTAQQNKERSRRKRLGDAATHGDITAFFKPA